MSKKSSTFVRSLNEGTPMGVSSLYKNMDKVQLQNWIEAYLKDTDYELVTLSISTENEILVEVDRLAGVDVDFCAELNRFLVAKIDGLVDEGVSGLEEDYSLEVGSVSLTDPFKTKMQFEKNLGHDVEIMAKAEKGEWRKFNGQLVSVDEDTFSVDIEEKVAVPGKKRKETQIVTHTWRYEEPKYVKYDLKF